MTAQDVTGGASRWSVEQGDCLDWLRLLPSGCVSMTLFSPPYEAARTYGIGFKLKGQDWVDWLAGRVVEMARVTEGLVFCNAAGQLRKHKYSPVVEWLVSDLTRRHGLVCGPAPYCYFRFSVPGSGGDYYHRRDWEPVYAFCRPEVLPLKWSDNTAEGHPPRWAPGGEMSNRLTSGQPVNQWGATGAKSGTNRKKDGSRDRLPRPSHQQTTARADTTPGLFGPIEAVQPLHPPVAGGGAAHVGIQSAADGSSITSRRKKGVGWATRGGKGGDTENGDSYNPPAIANPGNVVRERYDAETVRQLLDALTTRAINQGDVIRCLVGGRVMGSRKAHDNEAPFPERLAEFFVRSYAPPGSVVMDPFAGSGTTLAVALANGRRAIGCDLRPCQVALTTRRLLPITPPLFPAGGSDNTSEVQYGE